MKRTIALLCIIISFTLNASAQAIPYNGPESLVQNAQGQYASILLPANVSVSWSVTGGVITGGKINALVQFNAGMPGNLVLTAQLSNGITFQKTIPVRQAGGTLFQGALVNFSPGARQHPIYQLLRGERVFISSQVASGPKPILSLLDFQGRLILQDDTLDYKTTVRGSYYVVVDAKTSGSLVIQGVRPAQAGSTGVPINTPLTLDAATEGKLDKEIDRSTQLTGGEALIKNGDNIVSAYYDVSIRKTLIKGYQNDQLLWTWTSAEHEYIRTLNTGNNGEILAIGSSGGVGPGLDNVVVIRLQSNGNFITRIEFGTAGYDFGYGIAAFPDNSIVASGFTTGSFQGFSNKGGFDAFAVKISPTNTFSSFLQFGTNQDDRVFACKTLKNGNVLVFGDTEGDLGNNSNPKGEFDLLLTELTPALVQNWTEQYGSAENDLAFDLVIDPGSGDAFLTGMTTGVLETNAGNPTSPQVYLMRINVTSKAIAWIHQMGPDEGQSGETLALSDKGVGVLFYTNGSFPGVVNNSLGARASDDMVVAHFDFNGKLEWLKQFNQTTERIFARGIAFVGNTCYVLQDHVYVPDAVFSTTSLDRFTVATNLYSLNVVNGYGSGLYAAGDTVHIFANANASNQVFDRWTSSVPSLKGLPNLREYHIRMVIPNQNTTLTATYQTAIPWTFIETTIANKRVFYYFPLQMKGLILGFHGAGGSATGWIGSVENDNFHRYAVAHGYGILVTESNDRAQKRWANSPVSANNSDIVSINQILASLKTAGKLTGNEKLFAIGHSQGSGFGSVIAYVKNFTASAQYGVNGNDGVFGVSTVPTIWNPSRADTSADNQRLNQFYASYNVFLTRGIAAELHVLEPSPLFPERFLRIPGITPTQAEGIFNNLKTANYLNDKNYLKVNPRLNESYINSIVAVPNSFDGDIDDQVTVAFTEHKFFSDHNFLTIDFFDRQLGITTDLAKVEPLQLPKVFPNPFVDRIHVKSNDLDLEFDLSDQMGRLLYRGKNLAGQDFSMLGAGLYFLGIKNGEGRRLSVEKLLKL